MKRAKKNKGKPTVKLMSSTKRKQDFALWVLAIALNLMAILILVRSIAGCAIT